MIKIEQIFDYMNDAALVEKYRLSKEVVQSIETPKIVELDALLAENADTQLVSALQFSNIQKLVFSDFKYLKRLHNLLHTYKDLNGESLNTLLQVLSDSQKAIDDFSDEILYEGLQTYQDTHDILASFLYLYYRQTHPDSKEDDIFDNIHQCLKLPERYYCSYMNEAKEIRTTLQLPEYQQLLSELKQSTSLFPELSFIAIKNLNITTAPKFLHALNGNPYLSSAIKLLNGISLNTSDIFSLADSIDEHSYSTLTSILNILFHDNTLFTDFAFYWQKSDFARDMLTLFYKKATNTLLLPFDKILKNQMTFLSFLYHESYYEIVASLKNLDTDCTNLMIYALSNSKKHFLNLLLKNQNVSIESLGRRSILFLDTFYKEYFNIDSLDAKGLEKLLKINRTNLNLELLEKGRMYMKEQSKRRDEAIVSKYMWTQIITDSLWIFLLSMGMLVLHEADSFFRDDPSNKYLLTGYFAFFIFISVFNAFNTRTEQLNLFDNIKGNHGFLKILSLIVVVQICMTYFGGNILRCYGLTATEWLFILVLAFTIIPVDFIRKLYYRNKQKRRDKNYAN